MARNYGKLHGYNWLSTMLQFVNVILSSPHPVWLCPVSVRRKIYFDGGFFSSYFWSELLSCLSCFNKCTVPNLPSVSLNKTTFVLGLARWIQHVLYLNYVPQFVLAIISKGPYLCFHVMKTPPYLCSVFVNVNTFAGRFSKYIAMSPAYVNCPMVVRV